MNKFDPKKSYGSNPGVPVQFTDTVSGEEDPMAIEVIRVLKEEAEQIIPPGFRDHIKYMLINPKETNFDPLANFGVAGWEYTPNGKGGVVIE